MLRKVTLFPSLITGTHNTRRLSEPSGSCFCLFIVQKLDWVENMFKFEGHRGLRSYENSLRGRISGLQTRLVRVEATRHQNHPDVTSFAEFDQVGWALLNFQSSILHVKHIYPCLLDN